MDHTGTYTTTDFCRGLYTHIIYKYIYCVCVRVCVMMMQRDKRICRERTQVIDEGFFCWMTKDPLATYRNGEGQRALAHAEKAAVMMTMRM
mmetsp:Transcript_11958/g.19163  ORF Transcript_11958/g.19163 Transcript_11958/m.19163 type:complete len:91 (+) Transcript_11958:585-857(+)